MENTNTRLYYFKTKSAFLTYKEQNRFPNGAIAFIESPKSIYTHNQYWDGSDVPTAIAQIEQKIKEAGNGFKNGDIVVTINGTGIKFGQDNKLPITEYTAGEGISIADNKISQKTAGENSIGGIKLLPSDWIDNLQKKYRVQLDNYNRAFVQVPWEGGSNNGGSDGKNGGTWELIFCASETQPDPPTNGSPDISPWKRSAPNGGIIWMTSRFVTGDGIYNNWQTPWRISGPTGRPGEDGEGIEFVYVGTASAQLDSSIVRNLNMQWPNGSLGTKKFQDDDFVPLDWSDDPSGIDSSHKYEWAAVRYSNKADSNYKWTQFQGPFLWSKWGENGMDGDNVEYIYWAGPRNGEPQNPENWTNDPGFQTQLEYTRPGSGWQDNPIDLRTFIYGPGSIQLVSIRKKHDGIWGAYSAPVLWTSYPYDGTTGNDGIVADLDNDMMAVALKENGTNYAFSQSANIHLYAGVNEIFDSRTDTIKYVYRTDSGNTQVPEVTYSSYLSITDHTLNVNIQEGAVDFSNGSNIVVIIESSGKVNNAPVSRTCALFINGFNFGTDGASYKLVTSHSQIRRNKNLQLAPDQIDCKCVKVFGTDDFSEWTASQLESYTTPNGGHFEIWFKKDATEAVQLTTSVIHTEGLTDKIVVYLYFVDSSSNRWLVDQETIFIISDGVDGTNGQDAVVYQIHPISSSLRKGKNNRLIDGEISEYDSLSGDVFFYVTRTEGSTTVKIDNESLATYDLSITAKAGHGRTNMWACQVSYKDRSTNTLWDENSPWICKAWLPLPVAWNENYAFMQITLSCGEVEIASAIIPASVPGKDGNDAVQSLKYQITRTRVWTSDPKPAYNDGTEVEEDGITYADIVYYGQDVYLCVKAGTTETPGDSDDWRKFNQGGVSAFEYLFTHSAYIEGLTSKQVIVTNDNDKPVAGMLSGSAIPKEITTKIDGFDTHNVLNNSVRLFAGLPSVGGDIASTAWNVRENGDMYVGKSGNNRSNRFLADGSGFVANGNIKWDSDGKLTINASDWTSVLDGDPAKTIGNYIAIHRVGYTGPRVSGANNMQATFTMYRSGIVAGMYHVSFIGPEYPETPGELKTFWGNGGVERLWSYIEPKIKTNLLAKNTFKSGDTVNIEVQDYRIHGIRVLTYVASPNNIATDSILIPTVEGLIDGGSHTTTWSN